MSLEEGKDFVILNNEDKSGLFEENNDDTDILYLSRIGLFTFLNTCIGYTANTAFIFAQDFWVRDY